MATPEGRVKLWVDAMLATFSAQKPLWYFKPVQQGFGKPALDYIGCCNGRFFSVEAKAPGEWLTPYQRTTAREIIESGGAVFIVSSLAGAAALGRWLKKQ
jgi:hypothetical protein